MGRRVVKGCPVPLIPRMHPPPDRNALLAQLTKRVHRERDDPRKQPRAEAASKPRTTKAFLNG